MYLTNRLLQSCALVLVASRESFSSSWVCEEFAIAMRSSDLVLMLALNGTDPGEILRYRSPVFRWTVTAPVYAIDAGYDLKTVAASVAEILHTLPIGISKFGKDVLAASIASLTTLAFALALCSGQDDAPALARGNHSNAGIAFGV
jgi:hypothetical protein